MSIKRVIVCDDDQDRLKAWCKQIQRVLPDADVQALEVHHFVGGLQALKHRRRTSAGGAQTDAAQVFDEADVLVIDSDLTPDPSAEFPEGHDVIVQELTSEFGGEVAHLARMYTTVGAIVVVNELHHSATFDLTLQERRFGIADAYVTGDDVRDPGLWTGTLSEDAKFRPWSWPRLDLLPALISTSSASAELDQPWTAGIGINLEVCRSLWTMSQLESLGVASVDKLYEMTLLDFARLEPFGLRRREKITQLKQLQRISVCALRRWLDRILIPAQNILIDLPHLLERQPWLAANRVDLHHRAHLAAYWSDTECTVATVAHNSAASALTGRNVWNTPELPERPSGEETLPSDPVFCEDTSQFQSIENVQDFVSDIEGSHARRFVQRMPNVSYAPINRLAL